MSNGTKQDAASHFRPSGHNPLENTVFSFSKRLAKVTSDLASATKKFADETRKRTHNPDAEIASIQNQMSLTQAHIKELETELQMLRCQLAAAQRQSLAAKLREKGVQR